jgi:5-methylcytosine-specific restriction endonuclease McrA
MLVKRKLPKHTQIYFDYFGYDESSWIPCEVCGAQSVDIHHIEARSMGGNPKGDKDTIENLMALCRKDHENFGDKKQWKEWLIKLHNIKLKK